VRGNRAVARCPARSASPTGGSRTRTIPGSAPLRGRTGIALLLILWTSTQSASPIGVVAPPREPGLVDVVQALIEEFLKCGEQPRHVVVPPVEHPPGIDPHIQGVSRIACERADPQSRVPADERPPEHLLRIIDDLGYIARAVIDAYAVSRLFLAQSDRSSINCAFRNDHHDEYGGSAGMPRPGHRTRDTAAAAHPVAGTADPGARVRATPEPVAPAVRVGRETGGVESRPRAFLMRRG